MTSVEELQDQVRAFLDGRAVIDVLEEWLAQTAAEAAAGDDRFRRLHNSTWLRVGEFDEGLLSENELVNSLNELLPANEVLTWEGWRAATFASAHRSIEVADESRWQPVAAAITLTPWLAGATR
jgi:hypothetical protein